MTWTIDRLATFAREAAQAATKNGRRREAWRFHFLADELAKAVDAKDFAYAERDKCVALIARMAVALGYNAGIGRHFGEWEEDWRTIIYVDLPAGQVSWHIHDSERAWFAFLPPYVGRFDGHTTEEKYDRVLGPKIWGKEEAPR